MGIHKMAVIAKQSKFVLILLSSFVLALTPLAQAVTEQKLAQAVDSPYILVEQVTAEILEIIEQHRSDIAASESKLTEQQRLDCFFEDIGAALANVIDFDWIARNVMGPYGRVATADQRRMFAEKFRTGLVETYGRGLLSYSNQEIVLLPAKDDFTVKRRISVRQEIRSDDGNYPLEYTMGLKKSGQWQIINVIINGINIGKTFRNQFVQASQKNGGDIDTVIANWNSKAN